MNISMTTPFPGGNASVAKKEGSKRIALGLGEHAGRMGRKAKGFISRFAEHVDAKYYREWEDAGIALREKSESLTSTSFLHRALSNADEIHFNLDQIDPTMFQKFLKTSPMKVDYGDITNWELKTVLDAFADKTTFYGSNGKILSLTEVQNFLEYTQQ